jgi:hypothetical protein
VIDRIRRLATTRSLLVTAVAWLGLSSGNALLLARLRGATEALPIPDLQPLISPERLYSLLEAYGESGRRIYFEFTVLDMIYPVAAYAFFALVIAALSAPLSARASVRLLTVPATGLVLELAEQIGFLLILAAFPRRLHGVAWFTTCLTALKLTLLAVLGLVVAALCVRRLLRGHRPTSRST